MFHLFLAFLQTFSPDCLQQWSGGLKKPWPPLVSCQHGSVLR